MRDTTQGSVATPRRDPTAEGLVAIRAYPSPEAGDVALALLQASGVRGLLLRRSDGAAVVAVHARDEQAAERVLGGGAG
jgi:hypothetical protein